VTILGLFSSYNLAAIRGIHHDAYLAYGVGLLAPSG
jgi:hypothetical protein